MPMLIFMAGAAGAFIGDILKDGCLEMPKKIGGKFSLGFWGAMIIGGVTGYFVDGSPETAFLGGYVGKELLMKILPKQTDQEKPK